MSCGCGCTSRFQRATFLPWQSPLNAWPFGSPSFTQDPDNFFGVSEAVWQPAPGQWAYLHDNRDDFVGPHPELNGPTQDWADSNTPTYTKLNYARGTFDLDGWHVTESVTIYSSPDLRFNSNGRASIGVVRPLDETRALVIMMVAGWYQPWWPLSQNSRYSVTHKMYAVVFDLNNRSFGVPTLVGGHEFYNPSEFTRFNGRSVTAPALSRREDGDWDLYFSEEGVQIIKPTATNERDEYAAGASFKPRSRVLIIRASLATGAVSIIDNKEMFGKDGFGSPSIDVVTANLRPTETVDELDPDNTLVISTTTWGTPILRTRDMPYIDGNVFLSQRPYVRYNRDGYSNILYDSNVSLVNRDSGQWLGSYPIVGNFLRPTKLNSRMVAMRGIDTFDESDQLDGSALESFDYNYGLDLKRTLHDFLSPNVNEPHPRISPTLTFIDSLDTFPHGGQVYLLSHSAESGEGQGFFGINAVLSIREIHVHPGLFRLKGVRELWRSSTKTSSFIGRGGILSTWGPWEMADGTAVFLSLFWRRSQFSVNMFGVFLIRMFDRPQEVTGKVLGQRIDFEGVA